MHCGPWDAKRSGPNMIGRNTRQPIQEYKNLEGIIPAVVERTVEDGGQDGPLWVWRGGSPGGGHFGHQSVRPKQGAGGSVYSG